MQAKTWPEIVLEAVAYCEEHDLGNIVVDTWNVSRTGLRGDAENEAGAVLQALEPLSMAADRGLAVLLVAHQRKAPGAHGEGVRGSNALIGGVDIVLELVLELTEEGYATHGDGQPVRADGGERRRLLDALEGRQERATAAELASETATPASPIRTRLEERPRLAMSKDRKGREGRPPPVHAPDSFRTACCSRCGIE